MFIFLIGVAIGAVIAYYYINTSQKKRTTGTGNELNASRAELELRELRAEMARCKQENAQLKRFEEQLQEKNDECKSLAGKLAAAEAQLLGAQPGTETPVAAEKKVEAEFISGDPHAQKSEVQAVEESGMKTVEAAFITGDPHAQESKVQAVEDAEVKTVEEEKEPESSVEERVIEAPAAAEPPVAEKPDDLRKIEGIGPKVAQHLNDAGIMSFAQLAQAEVERLREILVAAGPAYKGMDPQSWPEQADLAAKENWDALKELQDKLDGGRYTS